jgi:hypothetical protein
VGHREQIDAASFEWQQERRAWTYVLQSQRLSLDELVRALVRQTTVHSGEGPFILTQTGLVGRVAGTAAGRSKSDEQ